MQISKHFIFPAALAAVIGLSVTASDPAHAGNPAARQCLIDAITADMNRSEGSEVAKVILGCHGGRVRAKVKYRNLRTGKVGAAGGWMGIHSDMRKMCGDPCK